MRECERVRERLDAYLDGELDSSRAAELEAHLATCRDCAAALDAHRKLQGAIRALAPYHVAPAALRQRASDLVKPRPAGRRRVTLAVWQLAMLLTGAAAVPVASLMLAPVLIGQGVDAAVPVALVDAHLRSLRPDRLVEVASTDRHTVKPWFAGKLDFSPPVQDLAEAGFKLTGGRVDYVENRAVAVLVYQRRQHIINVFIWPDAGSAARMKPVDVDVNGYHALGWRAGEMAFWAVSDLSMPELEELRVRLEGTQANRAMPR